MWAQVSFVLSQITCLIDGWMERHTDGQTTLSSLDRVACNACSVVKTKTKVKQPTKETLL